MGWLMAFASGYRLSVRLVVATFAIFATIAPFAKFGKFEKFAVTPSSSRLPTPDSRLSASRLMTQDRRLRRTPRLTQRCSIETEAGRRIGSCPVHSQVSQH